MAGYHGIDSAEKKWARMSTWNLIAEELGPAKFLAGPHLVLAGPQAADVGYLLGMGVPETRVVAIDKEEAALESAKHKWRKHPGLVFRCINVTRFPMLMKNLPGSVFNGSTPKFASIFLDFNQHLQDWLIEAVRMATIFGLRDGGVLAVNVLKGRENPKLDPVIHQHLMRIKASGSSNGDSTERIRLVWEQLSNRHDFMHHWLMPWGVLTYNSSEEGRQGSPMYTMIFTHEHDRLGRKGKKREQAHVAAMRRYARKQVTLIAPDSTRDPEWMRESVIRHRHIPAEFIGAIFNIPTMRVAAWRAHETMKERGVGPYRDDKPDA